MSGISFTLPSSYQIGFADASAGLLADGVTDQSAALLANLTGIAPRMGILKPGSYRLDSAVTLPQSAALLITPGVTFTGTGGVLGNTTPNNTSVLWDMRGPNPALTASTFTINGAMIATANSASAALSVTQSGSGYPLLLTAPSTNLARVATRNDRGSANQLDLGVVGSAAGGVIFGLTQNDYARIYASGANNLGLLIGTQLGVPIILGVGNAEVARLFASKGVYLGGAGPDPGAGNVSVAGSIINAKLTGQMPVGNPTGGASNKPVFNFVPITPTSQVISGTGDAAQAAFTVTGLPASAVAVCGTWTLQCVTTGSVVGLKRAPADANNIGTIAEPGPGAPVYSNFIGPCVPGATNQLSIGAASTSGAAWSVILMLSGYWESI